ncbi:MAG: glyoxalase/bleomycin resistance/dioxygenase family protein [Dokdonella sp.]
MMIRPGAVIYAKDLDRLSAFYVAVTALSVINDQRDHVVLEGGGFELVVVAIPARIAQRIDIENPPVRREESPIKLIFVVSSIAAARMLAPIHGGELNPAELEWELPGGRVCDGHDPEGNVIQLREIT